MRLIYGEVPPFDGRPVECEIGCADAQFLFERAALAGGEVQVGLNRRSSG